MQRIWTPSRPARSIIARCLAMLASRITSSFSAVEQAWLAWIRPHFTILGMKPLLGLAARRRAPHERQVRHEAQPEGHEPGIRVQPVEQVRIGDRSPRRGGGAQEARDDR